MSILPLSGFIQTALGFFWVDIPVQDAIYTAASGEDVQALCGAARTIKGAVDPSNARVIERMLGGSVSDGDIAVYTSEDLYIDDMYVTGDIRKQSFVRHGGVNYRVAKVADWTAQAGMKVYLAKRHVKQGVF